MSAPMMRAGALTALLLALCTTAAAQTVRCESPDGKVTYANVACPEGSKAVRTLPPADAPKPADAKAAQERLKADQQQAQKIDRQRRAEEDERARVLAAEAKKNDKRDLACRKLAKQVSDAEEDLSRAAINKREAADLRLQKARRQYAAECSG